MALIDKFVLFDHMASLGTLQILSTSSVPGHMGKFSKYYDRFWGLHYFINGEAELYIDSEYFHLQGSYLWAGYAGAHFTLNTINMPQGHYRAALQGAFLEQLFSEGWWPRKPLEIHSDKTMRQLFERFLDLQKGQGALQEKRRAHALEGCLLEAWAQQERQPQQDRWLLDLTAFLQEHCCDELNYGAIANDYLMPLVTLRRRFRKAMGLSIHEYVLRARTERAVILLEQTDKSIAHISEELGYADVAYFSRQFKRFQGLSPSVFRQQRFY